MHVFNERGFLKKERVGVKKTMINVYQGNELRYLLVFQLVTLTEYRRTKCNWVLFLF